MILNYRLNKCRLLVGLLLCLMTITACDEPDSFGIEMVDTTLDAVYVDTFTVQVSTVLLDSVATSGTGAILVGQDSNTFTGQTTANAFFEISLNEYWAPEEEAVFDYIELLLPYSGYSYGDTTQAMTLQVHQLAQVLEPYTYQPHVALEESMSYFYTSSGFYNTSSTPAVAQPLTSYTYQPRPTSNDTLRVPLPNELGQEWLQLKLQNHSRFTYASEFADYFKGIRLTAQGAAVVGFSASGAKVRLHYRVPSSNAYKEQFVDFALTTGATQYNQLLSDYNSSLLAGVVRGGEPLPAASSAGIGITQAGTGLMVKLEFPYLQNFRNVINPNLINMAVLEVETMAGNSSYPYTPPTTLALYVADQQQVPQSRLLTDYGEAEQAATYRAYQEAGSGGLYQFGLTQYVISQLSSGQPSGTSLLLGAIPGSFVQTLDRLCVGGSNHANRVKLKIYYSKLN